MRCAVITDDAAQVGAQSGDGDVVADVQRRELFRKSVTIGVGEGPLREIVGEAFRQEMVAAERLIRVVEDGGVAALLKAGEQFCERRGRLIPDPSQVGDGEKLKRHDGSGHSSASLILVRAMATSSGPRR